MNVRNLEVVCRGEAREDKKAITSCQLHQEIVEVPFLRHFCPFFFITVMVAALLISRHISLHYQLWWWGWWWALFTAGILWQAQQMSNNYSNRYMEAKKGEWLKSGYCVPERQGDNFFWTGFGSYSSLRDSCSAGLEWLIWGTQCVLTRTEGKTMNRLNHKTNVYSHWTLASSTGRKQGFPWVYTQKITYPKTFHPIPPPMCPAIYLSVWGNRVMAILIKCINYHLSICVCTYVCICLSIHVVSVLQRNPKSRMCTKKEEKRYILVNWLMWLWKLGEFKIWWGKPAGWEPREKLQF